MTREDIAIEADGHSAALRAYLLDRGFDGVRRPDAPAVLICPGGGYGFVSDREGEPSPFGLMRLGSMLLYWIMR